MKTETVFKKYIEFELLEGRAPHSVFEFCKKNRFSEENFYEHFNNLDQVKSLFLKSLIDETIEVLDKDENYDDYSGREKMLALFYTLFEIFKSNRSYLIHKYSNFSDVKENYKDWKKFFLQFEARVTQIIQDAKSNEEVIERPLVGKYYAKSFQLTFTYVFRTWVNDTSKGFETTDVAIEKSVNLAFELLGQGALDQIIDFGRFAIKNKVI